MHLCGQIAAQNITKPGKTMHPYRSHNCNALRVSDADAQVRLSGWIHRKRDHGNLLFVDLRDHYGITQVVIDISSPLFAVLEKSRAESVITVDGKVVKRTAETINPNLPTGEIEVYASEITVQSSAEVLPMHKPQSRRLASSD
jgi:aspartyl-tRNA synthetase